MGRKKPKWQKTNVAEKTTTWREKKENHHKKPTIKQANLNTLPKASNTLTQHKPKGKTTF
jgi:hypothetical protein